MVGEAGKRLTQKGGFVLWALSEKVVEEPGAFAGVLGSKQGLGKCCCLGVGSAFTWVQPVLTSLASLRTLEAFSSP